MDLIVFGIFGVLSLGFGVLIERFRRGTTSPVREGMLFSAIFWSGLAGLVVGFIVAGITIFASGFALSTLGCQLLTGYGLGVGGVAVGSFAQRILWKLLGR